VCVCECARRGENRVGWFLTIEPHWRKTLNGNFFIEFDFFLMILFFSFRVTISLAETKVNREMVTLV